MATPRIFVSSTCYDLHEIRHNLRNFIQEFAYEPVMSDYGDVFYEFDSHVQDSCLKEIEKSQMYVLIIGNHYGSAYHRDLKEKDIPDSVTLSEFKKSISTHIPKIIFINKFVYYDYNNYKRALNEAIKNYFKRNEVKQEDILSTTERIRKTFDSRYSFSQAAYPYIFHFLDIISGLTKNNAIFEYETFEEIKTQLKKQWAGFLHDKLTAERIDANRKESETALSEIKDKIVVIDKILREIFEKSKEGNGNISISIKNIEGTLALNQLKDVQEMLEVSLNKIFYEPNDFGDELLPRLEITEEITKKTVLDWLNSLNEKVNTYKWAKTIPVKEMFEGFKYTYWESRENIELEALIKLNAIYKKVPKGDVNGFIKVVLTKIKKIEKVKTKAQVGDDFDDDIPF